MKKSKDQKLDSISIIGILKGYAAMLLSESDKPQGKQKWVKFYSEEIHSLICDLEDSIE